MNGQSRSAILTRQGIEVKPRRQDMASADIKLESVTIVLRGNFNPTIFQPIWFSAQELLPEPSASTADIQLIHPQISAFSMDGLEIQVTEDRFIASSSDASLYASLRDLVVGTFTVLKHTPLRQLGLNWTAHLQARTEESWHRLGHILAPKDFWESVVRQPGMQSLTIRGVRPDSYSGHVNVKVEPSVQIRPGVFVELNDHFELEGKVPGESWPTFLQIMNNEWQPSQSRAAEVLRHFQAEV